MANSSEDFRRAKTQPFEKTKPITEIHEKFESTRSGSSLEDRISKVKETHSSQGSFPEEEKSYSFPKEIGWQSTFKKKIYISIFILVIFTKWIKILEVHSFLFCVLAISSLLAIVFAYKQKVELFGWRIRLKFEKIDADKLKNVKEE